MFSLNVMYDISIGCFCFTMVRPNTTYISGCREIFSDITDLLAQEMEKYEPIRASTMSSVDERDRLDRDRWNNRDE
jgi:hypothetical protein